MTFGGLPTRWEPTGGSRGLAVIAPGRAYSPSAPLLDFAGQGLLQHGFTVQQLWWDTTTRHEGDDPERGLDAIWLTPLIVEPPLAEAIAANAGRQLLVGGLADDLWDATIARELADAGCAVLEVADADHAMGTSDAVRTVEIHLEVARAVDAFLGGLS